MDSSLPNAGRESTVQAKIASMTPILQIIYLTVGAKEPNRNVHIKKGLVVPAPFYLLNKISSHPYSYIEGLLRNLLLPKERGNQ